MIRLWLGRMSLLFCVSCNTVVQFKADEVTRVCYTYSDASVAPEYHRSFDVTVTPETAKMVVYSYGDTLAEKQVIISSAEFEQVIKSLNDAQLVPVSYGFDEICEGGTAEYVTVYVNDANILYKGEFNHCGGGEIPAKYGDIDKAITAIVMLIPTRQNLLQ